MKTLKFLDKHLEEFIMVLLLSSIVVIMLFQIIRRYIFNDSLSCQKSSAATVSFG